MVKYHNIFDRYISEECSATLSTIFKLVFRHVIFNPSLHHIKGCLPYHAALNIHMA